MEVAPFLMFEGKAGEAIDLYETLFPDLRVIDLVRFGPEGPGKEGTISQANVEIARQRLRFFDSPVNHPFTFTPALSLFVDCDDEAQQDRLWAGLIEGGRALMPIDDYGFSRRFGWVEDRFGVSWQLNLP
jgi:predicted 3-demethylubiquinone-9 3-methyltransferase (glyoxalase superfamily)